MASGHVEGCTVGENGVCNCDVLTAGRNRVQPPLVNFTSGTTSSKIPRFDLIPYKAQLRLAKRFELGLETHKEKSWNARSKQDALTDEEFIIARASHVIHHAMKLIAKRTGQLPPDEDDDAAAIAWGGIFLCEATETASTNVVSVSKKLAEAGHLRKCSIEKTGVCNCAFLLDEAQARIDITTGPVDRNVKTLKCGTCNYVPSIGEHIQGTNELAQWKCPKCTMWNNYR